MARPTKYKPEHCERLIKHMACGYSFESFAGLKAVSVAKQTIYSWLDAHPDFKEACDVAKSRCRLYWERQGKKGLFDDTIFDDSGKPIKSRKINATMWIFNMKNRFPDEWKDKRDITVDDKESQDTREAVKRLASKLDQLEGLK